jgi:hypothetical protein
LIISIFIAQLKAKRYYVRKVAKKLLQDYEKELSSNTTHVTKRKLSEGTILDMISDSKKHKTMISLNSLKSLQHRIQLT